MNNPKPNPIIGLSGNALNIGLLLISIVPLLALSFYNHPSAADDYCYIYTVNTHGWTGGMSKYYNEWTGRYFGILLNHSNPLIFDWFSGFKIASVLLVLMVTGSIYFLAGTLLPTFSRFARLGFTGVVMFLFLFKLPSVPETFYWFASFVTYTVPGIMILLWLAMTVLWYNSPSKKRINLACCFLVFGAIGCSETTLLMMIVLIGTWFFYRGVIHKKFDMLMLTVGITAVLSCYFLFSAPGNVARLGGNPVSGDIPLSAIASVKFLTRSLTDWLLHTPILFFTVCWMLVVLKTDKPDLVFFSLPVWLVAMSYAALLFVVVFPSFYAISTDLDPTPRVVNSLYFVFLLGWFYLTATFIRGISYLSVFQRSRPQLLTIGVYALCCISVALYLKGPSNFKMVYRDWLKGDARAYDLEMKERYAVLRLEGDPDPIVSPIKTRPASLFVEDLNKDPKGWWNWCMAGYFGKESIRLAEEP